MTPKEKAQELLSEFVSIKLSQVNDLVDGIRIRLAKECALITVEEILRLTPVEGKLMLTNYSYINFKYWQEVKQEINKL